MEGSRVKGTARAAKETNDILKMPRRSKILSHALNGTMN